MIKDDVKIKYLIGSFRDSSDYPTIEDAKYLIEEWYFLEGGKAFIHQNKKIEDSGDVIFSESSLKDKLKVSEEKFTDLLKVLKESNQIEKIKESKSVIYYRLIK